MARELSCFVIIPSNWHGLPVAMARDERWGLREMPAGTPSPELEIDFDAVYSNIITDAIARVNDMNPDFHITCTRGQDIPEAGDIRRQVIEQICRADLTITDITSNNPNVFLEYGIRLSVKDSGNLLMCHEAAQNRIPFNIGHLRSIPYSTGLKAMDARKTIERFLTAYLKGDPHPERSLYYEYVELYAGRLVEKRLTPLARAAPLLIAELAERIFASDDKGSGYKERVFDYLMLYKDALSADPKDQSALIEHLLLVSGIRGLGQGRLRQTFYDLAKICNADPKRKEEGARYLAEAKKLED